MLGPFLLEAYFVCCPGLTQSLGFQGHGQFFKSPKPSDEREAYLIRSLGFVVVTHRNDKFLRIETTARKPQSHTPLIALAILLYTPQTLL